MKVSNTSQRLKEIMNKKGLKQIDILHKIKPLCEKYNIKMGSNDLSQYVTGKVEPSQKKLSVLAEVLDTNEVWLMGYDVPSTRDVKISNKDRYLTMPVDIDELNIKKGDKIKPVDFIKVAEGMVFITKEYEKMTKRADELMNKFRNKTINNKEIDELYDIFENRKKSKIHDEFYKIVGEIDIKKED